MFKPLPGSIYNDLGFQMMLTDEELNAWDQVEESDNEDESDGSGETPSYAKGLPSVSKICQVTKEEYHRFKDYLTGLPSRTIMDKIDEILNRQNKKEEDDDKESDEDDEAEVEDKVTKKTKI